MAPFSLGGEIIGRSTEPLSRDSGMLGRLDGGVRDKGEFLSWRRKFLSYTTLVPPGVVEYSVPPGVVE